MRASSASKRRPRFGSQGLLLTHLLLAASACPSHPPSPQDAGASITFQPTDAGAMDSGNHPHDAGPADAGVAPALDGGPGDAGGDGGPGDAGAGEDAGETRDAGTEQDAGAGTDAGTPLTDAGPPDAGVRIDAGPVYDPTSPLPDAPQAYGVDLPDLLWAYLGQTATDVAGAQAEMESAVAHGFTHARFVASPYWPTDMTTGNGWVANPAAFWAAFDALVRDAHTRGLSLTPSLLWNFALFPDVVGEPIGSLFTPGTGARTMAETYVTQVVSRYANDKAILFWEIGNELNLGADIDVSTCTVCNGATNGCGALAPSLGTPCRRTAADDYYSCNSCRGVSTAQQDLNAFTEAIGTLILTADPTRLVSTGNGYPRSSAYHLSHSPCPACDWTADSPAQYLTALANLTPASTSILSVHHYPGPDLERFGDDDPAGRALLAMTQADAQQLGKTLYVGEYGEPSSGTFTCGTTTACGGDPARSESESLLDGLVQSDVLHASLWAWDFDQFCAGVPTCYTVQDSETDFATSVATHNQALGSCTGKTDGASCPIGACSGGVCLPVAVATLQLDGSSPLSSWLQWTNCTGCTLSTWTQNAGGYAVLATNDLSCSGTCMYAGGYALSPSYPIQPGHLLVRLEATASSAGTNFNVIVSDAGGNELAGTATPLSSTGFQVTTSWIVLPPNAASVAVRLQDQVPNTTLNVRSMTIEWQP